MGSFRRNRSEFGEGENVAIHEEAKCVQFGLFSSQEIRQLSACNVSSPVSFNSLGHPIPNGLYDLKMGPFTDRNDLMCSTCLLHCEHCPGHLGHIELPLPVSNPLLYNTILKILKMSCVICHTFRVPDHLKKLYLVQQKLLDRGLLVDAQDASSILVSASSSSNLSLDNNEGEKRKKKTNKNNTVESTLINIKLQDFLDQRLKDINPNNACIDKNTRSIQSLRKIYNRDFLKDNGGTCYNCGAVTQKIVQYKSRFIYEGHKVDENDGNKNKEKTELNADEIRQHLRELWKNDDELLLYLFPMLRNKSSEYPTDIFFIDVLAVPPPKTRPCQFTGGIMTIHPQSSALQNVIETATVLKQLLQVVQGRDIESLSSEARGMIQSLRGDTPLMQMDFLWKELQMNVDHVLDREMNRSGSSGNQGWGFKQLIERKQGIFRMHMMGKRVNFAARTVITPDPNLKIDEIGLPEIFAKKLTYKVPVTPWNVGELREMVMNGPDVHPGAVYVESQNGNRKMIDASNPVQREALAKTLLTPSVMDGESAETKYVYRHLKNGDAMLLNRQPTLHKPSIMSHRARVLKGEKVMRLHYAICKSYNADFDGDEMNAHFPQNEVARSEAYNIVNVCKQYLVPKDGTPLQGLIQDHVIAGVKMTTRGRFFTRAEYQQLVYTALIDVPGEIKLLPPAMLKPQVLWSGKQIITTIIINLVPMDKPPPTMLSSTKIKASEWIKNSSREWNTKLKNHLKLRGCNMCESEVIFRDGHLMSGIMDKNQYGASMYSIVHAFFELYGGKYSGDLLSSFSKIFTVFLHTEGFTLGVRDIIVSREANKIRKEIMNETREIGDSCAAAGVGIKGEYEEEELKSKLFQFHRESRKNPKRRMEVDRGYKDQLAPANNKINSVCLPKGLIRKFPDNNLQLMVQAGAKGSTVNTMQISCALGQIELEGKRPPLMISGKSLPSFLPYDTQPRAGGFIDGRFMSGIKPQEFFFHCMAGREGLIDTAVKTSRSGYLQRCLIKLLEGLVVNYDLTVRDSDGSVVQFQYGEDSLDVCKSQYMVKDQMDFLHTNLKSLIDQSTSELASKYCSQNLKKIIKYKKEIKKSKRQIKSSRDSPFLRFSNQYKETSQSIPNSSMINKINGRSKATCRLLDTWLNIQDKSTFVKLAHKTPDPCTSVYRPDSNYSSVTEKIDSMIENYLDNVINSKKITEESLSEFKDAIYLKYMKSMVDPGEPVGVIAAQSVGEPSTQMTLNTFHFAGRGEMNVTLGIPRLREILMVASANIKTPSCTIPFLENIDEKKQEKLRLQLNKCKLSDVIGKIKVKERLDLNTLTRSRIVHMRFEFLDYKNYKSRFSVTPQRILRYFETKFITQVLIPVLSGVIKEKKIVVEVGEDKENSNQNNDNNTNDEDDDDKPNMETAEKKGVGEEHASSDEEELMDDADATETRKKARQADNDYEEGLSDEELNMVEKLNEEFEDVETNVDSTSIMKTEEELDEGNNSDDECDKVNFLNPRRKQLIDSHQANLRKLNVLNKAQGKNKSDVSVMNYNFDTKDEQWAELTMSFPVHRKNLDMTNVLKKSADKAIIHEVKNINRAIITKNSESQPCLTTDGVNIEAMFNYDHLLDLSKLSCNNIHEMAKYYGIEAANKTITKEIVNVFKAYGININPRHLSLIADYMTFDGTYKPFNRIGIENNPSPLQQMTFETATGFLRSAALGGQSDSLDSPSSRIVLGKPCNGGTGTFQIMQKLKLK